MLCLWNFVTFSFYLLPTFMENFMVRDAINSKLQYFCQRLPGKILLFFGSVIIILYCVYLTFLFILDVTCLILHQLQKGIWVSCDRRSYTKYKKYSNTEKIKNAENTEFILKMLRSAKIATAIYFFVRFLKLHKVHSIYAKFQVFVILPSQIK